MNTLNVVKVGWDGKDAAGEDHRLVAASEMVARGYMVNIPTLVRYPNGKIETGNLVKITRAGLEFFRREMPLEMRSTRGTA